MTKTLIVEGNRSLKGEVSISGSKNCALCLIAGALLCNDTVILNQIPDIEDIRKFIRILTYLNVETEFHENTLTIDASKIAPKSLHIEEVGTFRASYYLIGALIHSFRQLEISHCGGCNFVKRPINFHKDMFRNFGIECKDNDGFYRFDVREETGGSYTLPYPSFGTSVNALLYAVSSGQEIEIHNVTTEIEFVHFVCFLKAMGADILLEETNAYIRPAPLHGAQFSNIPDRIETGTFLLLGPTNCEYLKIRNLYPLHNKPILDLFSLLDIDYELGDDYVVLKKTAITKSVFIETGGDRMISSDLQPLLTVFCLNIPRISVIQERVYASRFTHIEPLKKLGAFVTEANQNILINGIMQLVGGEVEATDLRMGAAMVYAALSAKGISRIRHAEFIDRGYERFVEKLTALGADIKVYEE